MTRGAALAGLVLSILSGAAIGFAVPAPVPSARLSLVVYTGQEGDRKAEGLTVLDCARMARDWHGETAGGM